ncbi:hypothetical protein ACQ86L_0650 (plasmid) [Leifsonia sp. P73]|uniref:ParB family protein n=1 Tax=unclassified Leifsonia TaxID=2663824 RepID=UPI003703D829
MSDVDSPRRIEGLTPRRQLDLSLLQRKNREQPAVDEPAVEVPKQTTKGQEGSSDSGVSSSKSRPRATRHSAQGRTSTSLEAAAQASSKDTARISFYVPDDLSRRAKAAFRATAFQAGDRTWSAFLVRALESEVNRRESEYNAGERFEDSGKNLPAGRPLA